MKSNRTVYFLDGPQVRYRNLIRASSHELPISRVQIDHLAMHVTMLSVLHHPQPRETGTERTRNSGQWAEKSLISDISGKHENRKEAGGAVKRSE